MSQKSLDARGRWRNVIVAFRISPAENSDLNTRVRLSGLTKQAYIINKISDRSVVVVGNPRVYKALRNQLAAVLTELRRIGTGEQINDDLLETIRLIAVMLDGMKEENS